MGSAEKAFLVQCSLIEARPTSSKVLMLQHVQHADTSAVRILCAPRCAELDVDICAKMEVLNRDA